MVRMRMRMRVRVRFRRRPIFFKVQSQCKRGEQVR
jgi:hypothetical protein